MRTRNDVAAQLFHMAAGDTNVGIVPVCRSGNVGSWQILLQKSAAGDWRTIIESWGKNF